MSIQAELDAFFGHLQGGQPIASRPGMPVALARFTLKYQRISFCMRVEKAGDGGFACVRDFPRSGLVEQVVMLLAPDRRDADDYERLREPQQVRLVRHVASNGKVRVLMTNLFDTGRFPASAFGDLYHKRWRIEEAFNGTSTASIWSTSPACPSRPRCRMSQPKSCATTCKPRLH